MASPEPQWAWLGLLKWSLSYSDGTRPSDESMQEMSTENKQFLEEVMRDGILDEGERMKVVLEKLAGAMDLYQKGNGNDVDTEELEDLLQELRDIVEQIDYARAFVSLKGLPFLLGCIQQRDEVPMEIRQACLGITSTLCQNNPPVQLALLELGSIRILSDLFFVETAQSYKAKIIQAMSANIRNHATAEEVFQGVEQASELVKRGLLKENSEQLKKRTLFFLRAFITSDTSTRSRVRQFADCVGYIADNYLQDESFEIRELGLDLLNQILDQKHSVNMLIERKDAIAVLGVQRIGEMRALTGEDREYASVELKNWENLMVGIARTEADGEEEVLLLTGGPASPEALPQ